MTKETTMTLPDRLLFMAQVGDMGRKPDPDCTLRQAAAELSRMETALRAIADSKNQSASGFRNWAQKRALAAITPTPET